MAALLSYEIYSQTHNVITDETLFAAEESKAEIELGRVIGPLRWAELLDDQQIATRFYYAQLQDTIARVIDYQNTTGRKIGVGVASVSNDGYSESYNGELQTQSAATQELRKNIRLWLSGTGLVRAY